MIQILIMIIINQKVSILGILDKLENCGSILKMERKFITDGQELISHYQIFEIL